MTPAIKLLQRRSVDHQVLQYRHDPASDSYGTEATDALGLDPNQVFKTLLATVDGGQAPGGSETVVAVVPVAGRLDIKALAREAKAKKAAMADPADAERLTGYVVGGISPLGQRKRLRTFIDASAADHRQMYVSAGKRGLEVCLAPADLIELLDAQVAPISAQ